MGEQGPLREAGFPQGNVGATQGVRGCKRSGACPLSCSMGTGASGAHRSALCRVKGHGPSKGHTVRLLKAKSWLMPGCAGLCVQGPLGKEAGHPVGRTVTPAARRRAVVSRWRAGDMQSTPLAPTPKL